MLDRWLARIVALLLAVAATFALQNWSLVHLPRYLIAAALLLGLGLTLCLAQRDSWLYRLPAATFLLGALALFLLLRLAWIGAVPTLPVADFENAHRSAMALAQGRFEAPPLIEVGSPLLFGLVYWLFGPNLLAAKLLNLGLSLATALLLFVVARRALGEPEARVALLLVAIWPAQIMMSSVLASEMACGLAVFGALALLVPASSREPSPRALAAAGGLLGLACAMRTVAVLLPAAAVAWWLASVHKGRPGRLGGAALLVGGFALVAGLYLGLRWTLYGIPLARSSSPVPILAGANVEARGMWNQKDEDLGYRLLDQYGPAGAGRAALRIALERIRANPRGFVRLLFEKYDVLWADDTYGVQWSTVRLGPGRLGQLLWARRSRLYGLAQLFYAWLLTLAALGGWRLSRRMVPSGVRLLLLIFLGYVLLHSLVEVQGRYHYIWALFFALLAGYGLLGLQARPALSPVELQGPTGR